MISFFKNLNPIIQAFIAGNFTFFITVLGSSIVLLFKGIKKSILDVMLALSAGIMMSAAFFSLLEPAIDISNSLKFNTWLIVFIGFYCGGILLFLGDKLLNKLDSMGRNLSNFKSSIMLFSSITLHNIPEGLVLGVAFGTVKYNNTSLLSALVLTLGIGIQNFPEGSAISLPLRREGLSRFKAFLLGAISAIVEPIFAVLGAILVLRIQSLLPFILSFTAGAMIFVVVLELIPEALKNKRKGLITLSLMLGFSIMMILELLLG